MHERRASHQSSCGVCVCMAPVAHPFYISTQRSVVVPRLKKIWADSAYRGKEMANWCQAQGDWDLAVVERRPGVRGFSVLPKRWIVERTLGWLSRNRRMSKDYEHTVQTSETLIEVAMIRLLVVRPARGT